MKKTIDTEEMVRVLLRIDREAKAAMPASVLAAERKDSALNRQWTQTVQSGQSAV